MRRILSFRDFDWALLRHGAAALRLSVLEIYSATLHTKFAGFHTKQMFWIAGGLVAMFIFSKIDYHRLIDWAPWAYGVFVVALVAVLAGGTQGAGRAALDQARAHAVSAVGVGQAGADPGGGALLCQPGRTQPDLEGHLQGLCAGRCSDAAGADPAGPGNDAHLRADPGRRTVSWAGSMLRQAADPGHCGAGSGWRSLDERQDSQAVSEGAADQLHQSRQRPPRGRLPDAAVGDCRGVGRRLGQGRGQRARRRRGIFFPFPIRTSSLRPSARSMGLWARFLCCCYTSSY